MNETVVFYPSGHTYVHRPTGDRLTSVSKVLNFYEGEFDTDFWIHYKGIEEVFSKKTAWFARYQYPFGNTELERVKAWIEQETTENEKAAVLKVAKKKKEEWRRKSYNARRSGSRRHDKLERMVQGDVTIIKNDMPYKPMVLHCDVPDFVSNGIATEVTVFNLEFGISGRVDRVDKTGRDLEIIDYKTSKEIKMENEHQNFAYPLDFLEACNYNRYMLQLNTYGWMFSQFGFNVKKLTLVHDRSKKSYDVEIKPDIILTMLKHWKDNGDKTKTENSKGDEGYS